MILSPGRRYIFVHIPKTGGTSMALALEGRAMADDILIGDTPKAQRRRRRLRGMQAAGRIWKHSTLADIAGLVPDQVIEDALVVSMVRNPWDRLLSLYSWLRMQSFEHPSVTRARAMTFPEFVKDPQLQADLAAQPYAHYVTDRKGREHPCLWIRLEAWREDAGAFWDHLGFQLDLSHENASDRPVDYRSAYDAEMHDIVARLCADDISRFDYRF